MSYTTINLTMELVSFAVLLVLILSLLGKQEKTHQDRLFLATLLLHSLTVLGDMAAWGVNRHPGTVYRLITQAGNFLAYACGSLAHCFFMAFIIAKVSDKAGRPVTNARAFLLIMSGISALLIVLLVINQWTGIIYSIDADNRFRWGDGHLVMNLATLVQSTLMVALMLRFRKALTRRDMALLLTYELLPSLAVLAGIWQHRLMLAYPALMLALLLIYVNVQQEQEKQLAQHTLALAESRTAIMLSQIQPHFLFNALAAIEDLCREDPARASRAISTFSQYLRGNVDALSHNHPVPFYKELEHVRAYLALEQMRYGERLRTVFDIQAHDFRLPTLTLQPIVENAVRYGGAKQDTGGTVTIRAVECPTSWRVTVEDDGTGFDPDAPRADGRTHTGIDNVRGRLNAICGGTLAIQSAPGAGTVVTLSIPKGGDDHAHTRRR